MNKDLILERVEINKIAWQLKDIGYINAIPTYIPGQNFNMVSYMTRFFTKSGIVGEYLLWDDVSSASSLLLGKNMLEREEIFGNFRRFPHLRGFSIDLVLWDLAGKLYNAPVYQLLGGTKKKLKAYASTMEGGDSGGLSTPESYADYAEYCLDLGYQGYKIHPFTRYVIKDHVDVVLELGKRVGSKMDLMLDAFGLYITFADALSVCRACDEAGFYWIEDPLCEGASGYGHKKLREMIQTPLLQGEKINGLQNKLNLIQCGGTDIMRGNIYAEGLTGTMKLAHLAQAFGIDLEIHGNGPAQRHIMAAIPNTNYYEIVWVHPDTECNQMPQQIFAGGYSDDLKAIDENGYVEVPDGPGFGVEYDWDVIEKMTIGKVVHK